MEQAVAQQNILVVDDEPGPRESLRMILTPRHRVATADDGASALDILRTTPVDLVTVDLNMPGMRGDELMRTIREEFPHIEVVVITGFGTMDTAVEGIRYGVADYIAKPFDVVQVGCAIDRALERRTSRRNLATFLDGLGDVLGRDRDTEEVLAELGGDDFLRKRLRAVLDEPVLQPRTLRSDTGDPRTVEFLEVLAEAIESRDPYMRGHARRVAFYATLLADRLCLSATEREHVRLAAFLHDLGKVGVASDVVARRGTLDAEQREEVEGHVLVGERLVKPLGFSSGVASAIRHHHERWDGRGYPDGLAGDGIPLASRIVTIADAFDAITSARPHRAAESADSALAILRKGAGAQFDATLVDQFAAIVEIGACDAGIASRDAREGATG